MLRSLGQNPTDSEVNDMINELDVEGTGLIEFNQFAKFVIKLDMAEGDQEEDWALSIQLVMIQRRRVFT